MLIGLLSYGTETALFRKRWTGSELEEETDREGRKMWKQAGHFAAVGMEIGLAMLIGVFGGGYLDRHLNTAPVFFWIGFAVGIGAGVKAVVDAMKLARNDMDVNE